MMKGTSVVLLLCTVYMASALPLNDFSRYPYPRFIEFDGRIVDLDDSLDTITLNEVNNRNSADNLYLLFTRRNPTQSQTLVMNDAASIRNSNFNAQHNTVVVVHGWLGDQNSDINPTIRDAYLNKGEQNVIVLDWRRLSHRNYVTAANGVPAVGRDLGQFVAFLMAQTGLRFEQIHLVGFSLGAHLVGNAGRKLGGKVARVTGLDPAGPLWNLNRKRLSATDGVYVEAIHTDSVGGLGIGKSVAKADFYPNGGSSQPACLTNACNHSRSWALFAATVTFNHLIGKRCSSRLQITFNTCRGEELPMGNDDLKKTGTGDYRLETKRNYPF